MPRIGTPLSSSATRVLLCGSGELGKAGVIALQRLYQHGQVLTRVFSRAQEHGHDGDLKCSLVNEILAGLGEGRGAQLQIRASHAAIWMSGRDARSNGFHRGAPKRVTRSMGKENNSGFHFCERLVLLSPPQHQPPKGGQ